MNLDASRLVAKKTFVIIARFLLFGTICAMAQWAGAFTNLQLFFIVLVFGLTNLFFVFQPAAAFEQRRISTWIFLFDTFAISVFIFFLSRNSAELYLAYYLTIFIAAVARSALAAVATGLVSGAVYALLTIYGRTDVELYSFAFLTRLAFLFLTAAFIGYLAEEAKREREQKQAAQAQLRMSARLATLFDISNKMVSTMSIPELFRHIVEGAARSLEADSGSLMIVDPMTNTLRVEAAVGNAAEDLMGYTLRVGERIAGWVAEHGSGLILQGDARRDPKFAPYASPRHIHSSISAPLKLGDRILGVLNMNRVSRTEPFQPDDLDLLGTLANHSALVLDRVQLYRRIEELSRIDRLLGIYNRGAFDERLQEEFDRAQRYDHLLGLIILDVDGFKSYNDRFGHQAGDRLLREIAQAIKSTVRKSDYVARYGGDEIAIILPETNLESALRTAERARQAVSRLPACAHGNAQGGPITISAGVAVLRAARAGMVRDIIQMGDAALYRAKREGRNRVATAPESPESPSS